MLVSPDFSYIFCKFPNHQQVIFLNFSIFLAKFSGKMENFQSSLEKRNVLWKLKILAKIDRIGLKIVIFHYFWKNLKLSYVQWDSASWSPHGAHFTSGHWWTLIPAKIPTGATSFSSHLLVMEIHLNNKMNKIHLWIERELSSKGISKKNIPSC